MELEYKKASDDSSYESSKLAQLEANLATYEQEKCTGAMLRSKVLWTHESEKNTKYFLNLEKYNQSKKTINKLTINDSQTVSESKELLWAVHDFYSKLYKEDYIDAAAKTRVLNAIDSTLDEEESNVCENVLTLGEIKVAMEGLSSNKSPGNDGLTTEFYRFFWAEIGPILLQVFNKIFERGELTRVMKSGVITLIYKDKGDKTLLKNWRPISLLNVDYKIIARCMANRLKNVIGKIINPCQTCCIPGRDISDTLCSLRDVIDYVTRDDIETFS